MQVIEAADWILNLGADASYELGQLAFSQRKRTYQPRYLPNRSDPSANTGILRKHPAYRIP